MVRVPVRPELLRWASARSGIARETLLRPFPRLDAWERSEVSPTLKQVERHARRTHVPVGYLFLEEPPEKVLHRLRARLLETRWRSEITGFSPLESTSLKAWGQTARLGA